MASAGAENFRCDACHRTFQWPSLGDFRYGEVLLHGKGGRHRHVCVFDEPATSIWNEVQGLEPHSMTAFDVLELLADPVEGERLCQTRHECPLCGADSASWRLVGPREVRLPIVDIEPATFREFLSLRPQERLRRMHEVLRRP